MTPVETFRGRKVALFGLGGSGLSTLRALAAGGAAPTILNAANEIAVREFIGRRLGFGGIPALVEATLDAAERRGATAEPQSVEDAIAIDHNARRLAAELLPEIAAMAS